MSFFKTINESIKTHLLSLQLLACLALASTSASAQISLNKTDIKIGESFFLSYTDSQSAQDWVGLYKTGALNGSCDASPDAIVAYFLQNKSGGFTLSAAALGLEPGTYVLQMFQNYTYCHQGEPVTLTVHAEIDDPNAPTPDEATLSLEKLTFSENEHLVVERLAVGQAGDWIGLYPAGALQSSCASQPNYISWSYATNDTTNTNTDAEQGTELPLAENVIIFPPQSPGTYELQLFKNASYCHLGKTITITVEADPENPPAPLPTVSDIFYPTQEHFPNAQAEVQIKGLIRASRICYTTNGEIPNWRGGNCIGEGVKTLNTPADVENITLACNGETGPDISRPLNILFNWSGRPLYRAAAQYQLNCDALPEPEPEEIADPIEIEEEPINEDPINEELIEDDVIEEEEQEEEIVEDDPLVEEVTPTLSSDKITYALGEPVVITYEGGSGNPTDWIGIFPENQLNISCEETPSYVAMAYTDGIGGTVVFDNLNAGSYQAQLFENDGYCHLGAPIDFTIQAPVIPDQCPEDPNKTEPGECGCGIPEGTCNEIPNRVTLNPYAYVDWANWQQYKANYHTHTKRSDGNFSPAEVIDAYHAAGYKILSITDHDRVTWPWTDYNRDPATLDMLAVRGDEFSQRHHVNGFFDFTVVRADHTDAIQNIQSIQNNGGTALCHFNHPLRYNSAEAWDWYIPFFKENPACVGIETINRTTHAHKLWDNINENLFADNGQMVWGYANDDMHNRNELFRSFQFMIMPELTTSALNMSKITGAFYFCHEEGGSGEALVPRLADISVNDAQQTITLTTIAQDYESIRWVGPGSQEVGNGLVFDFSNYPENSFVRAEIHGASGSCYTQPFGIGK